jgi:hypothetical protein
MSVEEVSPAVIGLKVFGSENEPITNRPPRMPGSQRATAGGVGKGFDEETEEELLLLSLLPQPEISPANTKHNAATRRNSTLFISNAVKSIHPSLR